MEKRCRDCGDFKPADAFSPEPGKSDGLRSYCKVCTARRKRERLAEIKVAKAEGREIRGRLIADQDHKGSLTATHKMCTRCGTVREHALFPPAKKGVGGLASWCHICYAEVSRERRVKIFLSEKISVIEKRCSGCKITLPADNFHSDKYRIDGLQPTCKNCMRLHDKKRQARYRENYIPAAAEEFTCSTCKQIKPGISFPIDKTVHRGVGYVCKECCAKKHETLRYEVLSHYSEQTPFCRCCGESEIKFLSIDHIHGGGSEHREEIRGASMYRWLKRHGYPEGYQVLCHNCNQAKGFYGICPHQEKKQLAANGVGPE